MARRFAQVVLFREHERLNRLFSYAIPESLSPPPEVGSRVWVPFAREHLEGFVVGFTKMPEVNEVKEIAQVLGEGPVFSPEQIELARWMADYYMCPLIRVLKSMFLPSPPSRSKATVSLVALGEEEWLEVLAYWEKIHSPTARLINFLLERGETSEKQLARLGIENWEVILERLESLGLLQRETRPVVRSRVPEDRVVELALSTEEASAYLEKIRRRAPRQAELLSLLLQEKSILLTELSTKYGIKKTFLQALFKKGIIKINLVGEKLSPALNLDGFAEHPISGEERLAKPGREIAWSLNPEQKKAYTLIQQALNQADAGLPVAPIVLHGVTGSGKTEVYMQAISLVLAQGRKAIVLVPEIALTPQIAERFRWRFGSRVSVLHSRLTPRERRREWERIKEGKTDIVVGARSALFAPVERLGLIVLDEEHENSYKQDRAPRYHTREVAIKLAQLTGAVVVLGSATPTLETYFQVEQKRFQLLQLTQRVEDRALPEIQVVDLRQELKEGNRSIFSRALQSDLAETLAKKEQALLFLNRRGFSTFVNCRNCGLVLRCPNCEVALTYHQGQWLRCHYCNYQKRLMRTCPECNSNYLRHFGIGTQRVEEEVRRLFPQARTLRVDVDTTVRSGFYEDFFQAFRRQEIDILVGTQLIAKGLDFPGVTLVGVVTADTSLNLPDFRAAERTFQLLTQVAGRAGRGERPGRVVIQTYSPEHYSILTASQQDYEAFYRVEIQQRLRWRYPPSLAMVRVLVSGPGEDQVRVAAELLGRFLEKVIGEEVITGSGSSNQEALVDLLGPTPAPLVRVRGQYRWQLILRGEEPAGLRKVVVQGLQEFRQHNLERKINIAVDVDPVSMI